MKKRVCCTMSLVLAASMITTCMPAVTASADDTVTLTIWGDVDNQVTLEEPFEEINAAFEEAHPNIKLDYQWAGTFDSINVATQSDSLPDLFWVQGNKSDKMAELARNGYILNLDEYNLDASRYNESAIEYATVDGSVYCSYPAFCDYALIYYNKDIFEECGAEVPTTLSEFTELVKSFMDTEYIPLALGGNGEWDRYWLIQVLAPAVCGDTLEQIKNHEEIDWTGMETLFDMYAEYSKNGYMGKDFQATDGVGAELSFTNGDAAMLVGGTWANSSYRDMGFELGAFPIMDEEGVTYSQSGEAQNMTYAVSSKCEHPDEAVEYLRFLNSKEAEQIMEDYTGSIPTVEDIEPKDELIAQFADFDEVGANIYHVLSGVSDDNAKPQDVLMGDVVPKLMTGEITGAEGVEMIRAELEKSTNK